jgi:hypothetical protein
VPLTIFPEFRGSPLILEELGKFLTWSHVHQTVPNRNSRPAILLREGWHEGQKTRKRTLANLNIYDFHGRVLMEDR